jgi:leader peptidase (prepilin peptidase)/N-methyltransferase
VFAIWWFGPTLRGLLASSFLSSLLLVSLIDGEHLLVPDAVSVPLIVTGLLGAALGWGPALLSALGAAVGGALLLATLVVVTRGGIGTGDIILAAGLGANLGVAGLVLALWLCFVIGGLAGALYLAVGAGGRKTPIPYGPFLALGGSVAVFATPAFAEWVFRRFLIELPL